jgi:hypothetical protein
MRPIRAATALLLALAAAACASPRAPLPGAQDVPGSLHIDAIDVPEAVRPLVLTIYPTPRRVEYGDVLLPLAGAVVLDDTAPDFADRVEYAGLGRGWKELPPEGYVLHVTAEDGHTVVVKAARDDAGRRWADQALAELTWETPEGKFVRGCRVLDAPVFALRGNKRPQAWETAYRANFAWGARDDADRRGRTMAAVYAPGIPLDATGEGVARALDHFRPWQDRGVKLFAVKFDDEGFSLTPDSELRYGKFPTALTNFVRLVRQGLKRRDSDAKLYLLPQTYWWDDPRFEAYSGALRGAGGLEEDLGLVVTGPDVVSDAIDAPGLADARRAFGLTETKALIYDNLGREGDWGPLEGRDPRIALYADGVFGERGTPVNRLTRLDWLWNPEAYDPEASWRRAVLELAGPKGFDRFEAACRAFRRHAPREDAAALVEAFAAAPAWKGPVAQRDLVALLRGDCSRLEGSATTHHADPATPRRD